MRGSQQEQIEPLDASALDATAGSDWAAEFQTGTPAWYCARTKPKHEHIAAANLRRNLGLEVFNPRLRSERATFRGVVKRVSEPLFPCYIFVRCALEERMDQVRHTSGISSILNFGSRIPQVPEPVIQELRACFGAEESLDVDTCPGPGDGVTLTSGAFFGMQAVVLRAWPAKRRVEILLEILGRPTPMEVDCNLLTLERRSAAQFVPVLAAPGLA
jgi:transcriptional antiterminator RfaH